MTTTQDTATAEAESSLTTYPKFPAVTVQLVGSDGNAFAVLGKVQRALRRAGHGDQVETFMAEAMSGDYDHLQRPRGPVMAKLSLAEVLPIADAAIKSRERDDASGHLTTAFRVMHQAETLLPTPALAALVAAAVALDIALDTVLTADTMAEAQ